jgi:hypothetical protein
MIAPWQETKWIVLSSCFFLIPSSYAFQNQLYGNASLLLSMSLISVNYWRNARISWRRTTDLIYSKMMTIIFVTKGIYHKHTFPSLMVGFVCATGIVYFYHYSCTFHSEKKECWVQYHVIFHFLMTINMWLVVSHSIPSK